ncbi:GNAT family N-acetyltransferase [Psychrobacillus sp. NEAU-3TGS]|uniref:GNAT family N-acetyltransferase n=1 Tax=Psychrobacillus sp. NEAU-3TGS TaxID=2995412 RepID=UPI002498A26C|nr:GNAT family N-acetyltransferase [Psychrobacillus sp. NEAU-3TGS]MDI2587931.1 GNAT family N-acetyltransferase [Psychrobacillus sp. NEAU-3TGS]
MDLNIVSKISIVNTLDNLDWDELEQLFLAVEWEGFPKHKLQQAFKASYLVSLAYLDGRLVGCGRVVTDGVFYGSIYDIIVHPEFQGIGIGKMVMTDLLTKCSDIFFLHLTATHGREGFYEKLGLRKHKTAMGRYTHPAPAKAYLEEIPDTKQ